MIPLTIGTVPHRPKTLLCLGAHSDDIEIGCGGTILTWLDQNPEIDVHWVVLAADGAREREARRSAALFLKRARRRHLIIKQFRESYFPYIGATIKDFFEELKRSVSPDIVFTHYRDDRHQDHRVVSDLTWNSFRDHLILEYEIPKYDGDLGAPNCFISLDKKTTRAKIKNLCSVFRTQATKHWFDAETFGGLMRLRGMEAALNGAYAEAFYMRKVSLVEPPCPPPARRVRR